MSPKPTPTELPPNAKQLSDAREIVQELWQTLLHLNNALVLVEGSLHERTRKVLSESFNAISEDYAHMKMWVEKHDRQLELPEDK